MIHTISAGVGERMQYITHKYNDISQLLRLQMKMEYGAIAVDYQLRRGYCSHILK